MFGWWRRKSDGFEWREYVRTTVKLRREERARKIDEIKQAAASGAKEAGRQGVSAGRQGVGALIAGTISGARWLWAALVSGCRRLAGMISRGFSRLGEVGARIGTIRPPGWETRRVNAKEGHRVSSRVKIALLFLGLGALAGASALLQYQQSGASWSAGLAAIVSLVLVGLATTPWLRNLGQRLPKLRQMDFSTLAHAPAVKWAGAAAGTVLVIGAGYLVWHTGVVGRTATTVVSAMPSMPSMPSLSSLGLTTSHPDIEGRARAITGDTIRIGRKLVQLGGIEAPEISQICRDRRKRAWRCGSRARKVMQRLVRRKTVSCTNVTTLKDGRFRATCKAEDLDLAQAIVTKGYAFAGSSGSQSYDSVEADAKAVKRGIWQGAVQHPSEFRAQRWARASKSAPDGCPIKGRVIRKSKVYVLPWALDYRQVRVRKQRGERWFCSEAEASNAGFKPSSTG